MSAVFLPPSAASLCEETSCALRERIVRQPIATAIHPVPIATSYVQAGRGGLPFLLLHGFDSSVFEWRRLLPLLAERNEVWAVDLLGFGFTERPPGLPYGPEAIRDHLYHFWNTFLRRPVVLVGASMGGAAALDFARHNPEAVQRLVLIASVGFTSGVPPLARYLFFPFNYLAAEVLRSEAVRQKVARQAYANPCLASADASLCARLHLECPGWRRAMVQFTRSGGYSLDPEQMAEILAPTLVLWGTEDRILGTADAERFAKTLPDTQVEWVPDCGHVPHLECPVRTAESLLAFAASGLT